MTFKRWIIQFLEAQTSSLLSTFVDFAVTAILVKFAGIWYVIANIIGAVSGGSINCVVNYNWAFKGTEQRKRTIFYRYLLVWFGSIFFNTAGTTLLANILSHDGTPKGFGTVMESKTVIAIIVAIFWNYLMQKKYVYKK